MRVNLKCINFYVEVSKWQKKVCWSSDLLRVKHYTRIRARNCFSLKIYSFGVSKDAEFNVDFKNMNVPWCAPKQIIRD
jgi:hypothetical protein